MDWDPNTAACSIIGKTSLNFTKKGKKKFWLTERRWGRNLSMSFMSIPSSSSNLFLFILIGSAYKTEGSSEFNHASSVRYRYWMIKILLHILPLSVNVWQMLWRSSDVFPMEMAEVKLLWLHIPSCTSANTKKTTNYQKYCLSGNKLHPSIIYRSVNYAYIRWYY